ncbi:uncharacterized protein LOC134076418 [Sardina pilchardus]|uniref:uncharacterized protein LOC134076418 n=1 Tax=Sardina pilchardus TaxID=27697 RepID=UPI002E11EEAC
MSPHILAPVVVLALFVSTTSEPHTFQHRDAKSRTILTCDRCPTGFYMKAPCTPDKQTICTPCPLNHVTQFQIYMPNCQCLALSDRMCECLKDYYKRADFGGTLREVVTKVGQSITLNANRSNRSGTFLQWLHNCMVIAHWYPGEQPGCLYPNMELDTNTFTLNMSNIQRNATGLYELVNAFHTACAYQLTVFETIQDPIIIPQCNSTSCTLNCTGSMNNDLQYVWTNNRGQKVFGSVWVVEKSEHLDVVYTCNSSNSVNWKTKGISEREFFKEPSAASHLRVGVSLALVPLLPLLSLLIWRLRIFLSGRGDRDGPNISVTSSGSSAVSGIGLPPVSDQNPGHFSNPATFTYLSHDKNCLTTAKLCIC